MPAMLLQGRVFVDRDPKHFRLILNFLRDGTAALPTDPIELQEIKQEAEFFQVGDTHSNSKHKLAPRSTLSLLSPPVATLWASPEQANIVAAQQPRSYSACC